MDNSRLLAERLTALALSLDRVQSDSERAALYGAARWLLHDLREALTDQQACALLDSIQEAVTAALGFDIGTTHRPGQHIKWAVRDLDALKKLLRERG